jgi:hypothetical protein
MIPNWRRPAYGWLYTYGRLMWAAGPVHLELSYVGFVGSRLIRYSAEIWASLVKLIQASRVLLERKCLCTIVYYAKSVVRDLKTFLHFSWLRLKQAGYL